MLNFLVGMPIICWTLDKAVPLLLLLKPGIFQEMDYLDESERELEAFKRLVF